MMEGYESTTLNQIIPGDVVLMSGSLGDFEAIITGRGWDRSGVQGSYLLTRSMHGEGRLDVYAPGGTPYSALRRITESPRGISPGCYVDSHHGTYAIPMVIELATSMGMGIGPEDMELLRRAANGDDEPEDADNLYGLLDQAEEWLNLRCRPDDLHTWSWEQGDFGLYLIGTGEGEDTYSITQPIAEARHQLKAALLRRRQWAQAASSEGLTQDDIAELLGISRQRAQQLIN